MQVGQNKCGITAQCSPTEGPGHVEPFTSARHVSQRDLKTAVKQEPPTANTTSQQPQQHVQSRHARGPTATATHSKPRQPPTTHSQALRATPHNPQPSKGVRMLASNMLLAKGPANSRPRYVCLYITVLGLLIVFLVLTQNAS